MIQAALMTRSLVSVDQALVGHTIDSRHSMLVGGFCFSLIAFINCVIYIFYAGTHHCAHAHVVGATVNGLSGAFFCSR